MLPPDATSRFVLSDETATLRGILDSTVEGIVFINEQLLSSQKNQKMIEVAKMLVAAEEAFA